MLPPAYTVLQLEEHRSHLKYFRSGTERYRVLQELQKTHISYTRKSLQLSVKLMTGCIFFISPYELLVNNQTPDIFIHISCIMFSLSVSLRSSVAMSRYKKIFRPRTLFFSSLKYWVTLIILDYTKFPIQNKVLLLYCEYCLADHPFESKKQQHYETITCFLKQMGLPELAFPSLLLFDRTFNQTNLSILSFPKTRVSWFLLPTTVIS